MKPVRFQPPRPPKKLNRFADDLPLDLIEDDTTYSDFEVSERDYTGHKARRVVFARCSFERVVFAQSEFPEVDLSDFTGKNCDFANAGWRKAILHRVELDSCRLVGLGANEAHIGSTLFRDCNASLAQFRFSNFKAVRFENCNLYRADFQEADLRGVIFQNCDLREAQMSFAKLDETDFRGSDVVGLQVNVENLKGAIVEPFQAAYFAGLMGLNVKWS